MIIIVPVTESCDTFMILYQLVYVVFHFILLLQSFSFSPVVGTIGVNWMSVGFPTQNK